MKGCAIPHRTSASILALLIGFSASSDQFASGLGDEALLFEDVPSVFGASKYEQKVTEAPSRISIVTAEEIQRYGYRTFSELLRSLPGFSVTNDRNYAYTGVRGFGIPGDYDTRLLQLVDGHRINDNLYGSLYSDNSFPVDLHLIDRVEVIRGPSSSLYGSGAFFAVVNVITKKGRDIDGWQVSGSAGSLQNNQGQLTYGRRYGNGAEVLVSAMASDSVGNERLYYAEFDDPSTSNGVAEDKDGEDVQRFFTRVSFGDFSLEGVYGQREKAIPTAPYDSLFNANETRTWDNRGYLDLKYETLLQSGAEVVARVYYDSYWYKGEYMYDYGDALDPYLSLNHDYGKGAWWGSDLQWAKQLGNHRIVAGTEYRNSLREEQGNYDQDGVYLDVETDSAVSAVFAQDEIQLNDKLTLNLGLRYDRYSNFGGTTNPRAALIWTPSATSVMKVLYGQAFRAPNAFELYYNEDVRWKPSPNLSPETIDTRELVWEQQLSDGLRGVVAIYTNEISNLIALTTDPADGMLVNINEGDAQAEGAELELEYRWTNGTSAVMSYSYQHAEDVITGARLVNYSPHVTKLNLVAPILNDGLDVALEAQHEAARLTIDGNESGSRMLLNLSLFSEVWMQGLTASMTIYNLFDETYAYPASEEHEQDLIEQDGRTLRLRLAYAF